MSTVGSATRSDAERAVLEGVPTELFIGGQWRAAAGGGTLAVEDPATTDALVEVADAQAEDALAALAAAADAQAGVGGVPAARARRDPAPRVRGDRRAAPTSWRC